MAQVSLSGVLVARKSKPYEAFTDAGGRQVPAGESMRLWAVTSMGEAPVVVKVPARHHAAIKALPFASGLAMTCYVTANGGGAGFDLVEYEQVPVADIIGPDLKAVG